MFFAGLVCVQLSISMYVIPVVDFTWYSLILQHTFVHTHLKKILNIIRTYVCRYNTLHVRIRILWCVHTYVGMYMCTAVHPLHVLLCM